MRLPINNQQQPRPYLAPFSHSTSVMDRWTTTMTTDRPLLKYGRLKTKNRRKKQNWCKRFPQQG